MPRISPSSGAARALRARRRARGTASRTSSRARPPRVATWRRRSRSSPRPRPRRRSAPEHVAPGRHDARPVLAEVPRLALIVAGTEVERVVEPNGDQWRDVRSAVLAAPSSPSRSRLHRGPPPPHPTASPPHLDCSNRSWSWVSGVADTNASFPRSDTVDGRGRRNSWRLERLHRSLLQATSPKAGAHSRAAA